MKQHLSKSFISQMHKELNANAYKGNWLKFAKKENIEDIINEYDHHAEKLFNELYGYKNIDKIKEYTADLANILMFINKAFTNEKEK